MNDIKKRKIFAVLLESKEKESIDHEGILLALRDFFIAETHDFDVEGDIIEERD